MVAEATSYLFESTASPTKLSIAQQQIDGAIRAFVNNESAIVSLSLIAPASQILRDLNKGNPKSMAQVLHEMALGAGYSTTALWREFNDRSANYLKHAKSPDSIPTIEAMEGQVVGGICFCILEYRARCDGISAIMAAFARQWLAHPKRPDFLKRLLCRTSIQASDAHLRFWIGWVSLLRRLQRWVAKTA